MLIAAVGVGALGGAGGAVLGVPALRHGVDRLVHPVPEPSYTVPAQDVTVVSGSFVSRARIAIGTHLHTE